MKSLKWVDSILDHGIPRLKAYPSHIINFAVKAWFRMIEPWRGYIHL